MLLILLSCLTAPASYRALVRDVIDADGDGFYDEEQWAGDEHLDDLDLLPGDCNDDDPLVNPDAEEICDGVDNDCDGGTDEDLEELVGWYIDDDRDGFGDPDQPLGACPFPDNAVEDDTDCDDTDAGVFPGAAEACNGVDDDCDGEPDDGAMITWYEDPDADGYGSGTATETCDPGEGYAQEPGDCDESDPDINPGETEVCNDGIDNDCDETTDCRWSGVVSAETLDIVYGEVDGDSFGARLALGDIDGAAANDLLVSAADAWVEGEEPGKVYLFKDGLAATATDAHSIFIGPEDQSGFGVGVDLFDLDGDSRDEVIVGGDRAGGTVHVFTRPWNELSEASTATTVFTPSGSSGRFGHAVAGFVDIDGAGTPGIGVGAISASTTGGIYAVPYQGSGEFDPVSTGTLVLGEGDGDELGEVVTRGDLDGDGVPELLASAPGSDRVSDEGGAAYVFELPLSSTDIGDARSVIGGAIENGRLEGINISDLDDDGVDDLFLGAPATGWDPAGTLYVFTDLESGAVSTATADLRVDGETAYGGFGYRGLVLDLDNTGGPDLAVAASLEGAVYLFYDAAASGVLTASDADGHVELTSTQKLPLVATQAWSPDGQTLVFGCKTCVLDSAKTGAFLWLDASGP